MQYMIPDYYKAFSCTADRCEETCCAGWQIVVDDRSWKRYCRLKGPLGRYVRRALRRKDHTFRQTKEGRCAFLDQNNLCRMYQTLGRRSLCRTCRRYPRHVEEFENVREITLSLSCPEVVRILLEREEPVHFLTYEKEGEETYENYDPFLYSILADGREIMRLILQDRTKTIDIRVRLILKMAEEMQLRFDQRELFGCEEVFEKYENPESTEAMVTEMQKNRIKGEWGYRESRRLFQVTRNLERLKDDWEILLQETEDVLYARGAEGYEQVRSCFEEWRGAHLQKWDVWMEQYLVYFLYTYFCGAVYDGKILNKVKMTAAVAWVLQEILMAKWVINAEELNMEDVKEVMYRYSRELEHSDINLRRLEEGSDPLDKA